MAAVLREHAAPEQARDAVVIVGAGPVGIRVAQELARRDPARPIVIYGDERTEPYNRVRLSAFLAGELDWQALTRDLALPETGSLETRYGCAVVAIDAQTRMVSDARSRVQPFGKLVLATGSRPHVPSIPGITLPGVYTFRDVARRAAADRARGAQPPHRRARRRPARPRGRARDAALQHRSRAWSSTTGRLMMRQLDEAGAARLLEHVRAPRASR